MTVRSWMQLVLLLLGLSGQAVAAFDVVTLTNGDILNGTVVQQHFTLQTRFGRMAIPYGQMQRLVRTESGTLVETLAGERLQGDLEQDQFTVLRVLDPTLPVATTDIQEIRFQHDLRPRRQAEARDVVESINGDRVFVTITSNDLMVKSRDGIGLVAVPSLWIADVLKGPEDDAPRLRIIDNSGNHKLASALTPGIRFRSPYGADREVELGSLRRIVINARPDHRASNFNFQRPTMPWARLQDHTRSGQPTPELVALRGGSFQRGADDEEADGDEKPPTQIQLKPFAIGVTEVTYRQYELYCRSERAPCPEREVPDDHPVVNVSWEEATAYTRWLSRQTGKRYRLPSDAEWEYAARGSSVSRYWWGDEPGQDQANCEGCGSLWDGESSAPVGRFSANPFGLQDTAGNVFEWVADCWQDSFAEAPADGSPIEKPDCGKRVIRGGAWSFPPHEIRSANRWRDFPSRRSDDTGFRVARDL